MAKLTDEMKALFGKQLPYVATASKDGTPNIGPKGSVHVLDDETLAYAESTGEKTYRNLLENPKITVVLVDREKADGYQIKGTVELISSGDLFDKVTKRQQEKKRSEPKYVGKIKISEIYSIKSGKTGKKLA